MYKPVIYIFLFFYMQSFYADEIVTNTNSSGPGSFDNALGLVNDNGTISFDPTVFSTPQTISLPGYGQGFGKTFHVDATNVERVTIDGQNDCSLSVNGAGHTFSFSNLRFFRGGSEDGVSLLTANQGALNFSNTIFSSCIADSGAALFAITGTLTLTNVTITDCHADIIGGAIYLTEGSTLNIHDAIQFSNNTAPIGQDIYAESGVQLNFDLSTDSEIPNPIEGNQANVPAGGLLKSGPAKLTLNGDNTYTGTTTIEAGTLQVEGSVITDVIVDAGAKFAGNAIIKAGPTGNTGSLINSGLVCPGLFGVGHITIEGDYEQTATGILEIDITPQGTVFDKLLIDPGQAIIDGELKVIINQGNYISGTQYQIIDAPVTGTFSQITKTGPDADKIEIEVNYNSVTLTVLTDRIFEDQTIQPENPQRVVNCILAQEPLVPNSPFALFIEALGTLSDAEVNEQLNHMSAAPFGALEWIHLTDSSLAARLINEQIANSNCQIAYQERTFPDERHLWLAKPLLKKAKKKHLWLHGYGYDMNEKSFHSLRGFTSDAFGILLGFDNCHSEHILTGFALGYSQGNLHWKQQGGSSRIYNYFASVFGRFLYKYASLQTTLLGGGSTYYKLQRQFVLPSMQRTATSYPQSFFLHGRLASYLHGKFLKLLIQPFGAIDYSYWHLNQFKEHGGGGIALEVESRNSQLMQTELGLQCKCHWSSQRSRATPYVGVSWMRKFALDKGVYYAHFVGQNCQIKSNSFYGYKELISPFIGLEVCFTSFLFRLGYKAELSHQSKIQQFDLRLQGSF